MKKILIAVTDRDEAIRINNFLEENEYAPFIVTDSTTLVNKIHSNDYGMLLVDFEILETSEMDLSKFIKERPHAIQPLIITPKEKIDRVIALAQKNDFLYIQRPINFSELKFLLDKSESMAVSGAHQPQSDGYFEKKFVGRSEKFKKIAELVKKVAKNDSNILITGETGTGKELVARAIYEMSARASMPFIAVNSSAIPENLLESELFGYKQGAFTDAKKDKKGLIEMADNGTLFLDEIGDLSAGLQAKLLRVLEYKELRRVGDENLRKVNIRIIAATHQDLAKLSKDGKFREDLFYRLNVIQINIPPLRERKEDIPVLLRFFIEKYNKAFGKDVTGIDSRARAILAFYDYPGNVRELENIIQHAFNMAETEIITVNDLPGYLQQVNPFRTLEAHAGHDEKGAKKHDDGEFLLAGVEKATILRAFEKYGENHTKVARALGVSRSTLWRKIKQYKIKVRHADAGDK